jgi:hypothetical protein
VERCLACEAVVSKETLLPNAPARAAFCDFVNRDRDQYWDKSYRETGLNPGP